MRRGGRSGGRRWHVPEPCSEVDLRAELHPPPVRGHAARLAEVRVRARRGRNEVVEAPVVLVVERVEQIGRDSPPRPAQGGEVLTKVQVDVPVRPRVRDDEIELLRVSLATPQYVGAARRVTNVERGPRAYRDQSAELDARYVRALSDPTNDDD